MYVESTIYDVDIHILYLGGTFYLPKKHPLFVSINLHQDRLHLPGLKLRTNMRLGLGRS